MIAANAASDRVTVGSRARFHSTTHAPGTRDDDSIPALISAARAGDPRAWEEIVKRFGGTIRAVTRGFRLMPADADDVMQETWLRLLRSIDRIEDPGALKAWLVTTARRESLRSLQRTREVPSDHSSLDEHPDPTVPEERLVAEERRRALREAINDLPAKARALLQLLLSKPDCGYDEVSAKLGMPIGSIGPTRGRLLARLREHPRLLAAIA
jgi:RNA polymerase sigma factor (sigma-70 family)